MKLDYKWEQLLKEQNLVEHMIMQHIIMELEPHIIVVLGQHIKELIRQLIKQQVEQLVEQQLIISAQLISQLDNIQLFLDIYLQERILLSLYLIFYL